MHTDMYIYRERDVCMYVCKLIIKDRWMKVPVILYRHMEMQTYMYVHLHVHMRTVTYTYIYVSAATYM